MERMVINSADEYRESLKKGKPMNIYFMGEKVEDNISHPIMKAAINSIALTYDLARDPNYEDLMIATST